MHRKCKHIKGILAEAIRIVSGYYQLIGLLSERPIRPYYAQASEDALKSPTRRRAELVWAARLVINTVNVPAGM